MTSKQIDGHKLHGDEHNPILLKLKYLKIWNNWFSNLWLDLCHTCTLNFYIKVRENLQTIDNKRGNGARVWTSFYGLSYCYVLITK